MGTLSPLRPQKYKKMYWEDIFLKNIILFRMDFNRGFGVTAHDVHCYHIRSKQKHPHTLLSSRT